MAGRRLIKLALNLECTMFHEVKIFDKKVKAEVKNRKITQNVMMKVSNDLADFNP
jgi:hypothetical protein